MQATFGREQRRGVPVGVVGIVVLHVLVVWGLSIGLHRDVAKLVQKPLEATLLQELKLPPPPPPPPPPKEIRKLEAPKPEAPPPPYVPPPDVAPPSTTPAPVIAQTVDTPPPAPAVIAPAPPVQEAPRVVSGDIAVVCPKQVKPELPDRLAEEGIGGRVRAEAHIRRGKVVDVKILSGHRQLHQIVRAAMMRYECQGSGDNETVAVQDFNFKIE